MARKFEYDIFLSYASKDKELVEPIYKKMIAHGLECYWAPIANKPGESFPSKIGEALGKSQQFMVYCSSHSIRSNWVRTECDTFFAEYHNKDKENRPFYLLLDDPSANEVVPELFKTLIYPESPDDLIAEIVKNALSYQKQSLEQEEKKVAEAREYYQHERFWHQIASSNNIHIFTCGRDVKHDPNSPRGYGGRTNIDVWDYRAVFDLTHFFSSRYPGTRITIEDPMSKLHELDLQQPVRFGRHLANMQGKLRNKDCIIIGSPDVSDFAEIVLAEIHGVEPYVDNRIIKKGYILIKEHQSTRSSFYWQKEETEQEGVARILDGKTKYFHNRAAQDGGRMGKMYGILIVANNPFSDKDPANKIIILSGFSGPATNSVARLLTYESYLEEFYKLDQKYVDINRNIEVLVGVEYSLGNDITGRDTRHIKNITFEGLMEIPKTE
jgi:hypothetical protein